MSDSRACADLPLTLRHALRHLYDPMTLADSPLIGLLGLAGSGQPSLALQTRLTEAIAALEPPADTPPEANAWRYYQLLEQRYVEQFAPEEVATNLALSVRQARRLHREALQALANYLWGRYGLEGAAQARAASVQQAADRVREHELEWLRQSVPSERVDVAAVLQSTLAVVSPLLGPGRARIKLAPLGSLFPVAVQQATLRQALLGLLLAAAHQAQDGEVHISAENDAALVVIHLRVLYDPAQARADIPEPQDSEKLAVARELLALSGGDVQTLPAGVEPWREARVLLPAAEQLTVLVIDDNADALHLYERYLEGTPFRCVGSRDPREALRLADQVRPCVIILDLMLPDIDGWELLGQLRGHPICRGVPIIVSTVLPYEELALALGAAVFLRKPASREVLLRALERLSGAPGPQSR